MRRLSLTTALCATLAASPAAPHPHVFVDGTLGFVIDDDGLLTHLKVVWVMDAFYSLFAIEEAGVDEDRDDVLTDQDRATLAAHFSNWQDGYDGDSALWAGDRRLKLGGPEAATIELLPDGRLRMEFQRPIALPFDPRVVEVTAKAYDPTFYTYYAITEPPTVSGDDACTAIHEPLKMTDELADLQLDLLDYDPYASPEDPTVGSNFADTIRLTCAPRRS